jgi:transposase-like protein
MSTTVQSCGESFPNGEKITRVIRIAIGFDLGLDGTRWRHKLWKLFERFPDEYSARIYFEQSLWPNGRPICPRCESGEHVGSGRDPYRCNACDRQFTVRTATILERSRIPLHYWLWAIVIFATARRRVSGVMLAAFLGISQPAAWGMICKLRSVWNDLTENFPALRDQEFLDFVDFSDAVRWPFFSYRTTIPPEKSKPGAEDAYLATPEEAWWLDIRSSEEKALDEAVWKAREQDIKTESWTKQVKAGGKRAKRFLECVARRRERFSAHLQDHLRWVPFKWMTMRDCPMCRFGEREWRHWEEIAPQLDLPTWVEFWDWIEDLRRQYKRMVELKRYEDECKSVETVEIVPTLETSEAFWARMEAAGVLL